MEKWNCQVIQVNIEKKIETQNEIEVHRGKKTWPIKEIRKSKKKKKERLKSFYIYFD